MRITITPSSGTTAFVLGDDDAGTIASGSFAAGAGGQIREGFVNKQKRRLQKSPLFRGAYALNLARFNFENRFSFTVQRSFQSLEDCAAFIALHPDSVPASGEIILTTRSASGLVVRYLPGAVVESVECVKQIGLSCDFQYTISGNGPWQSTP